MEPVTRPSEPIRIGASELADATCQVCRATIAVWESPVVWSAAADGAIYFNREQFAGMTLLSLHNCIHEWTVEDLDDPDFGYVPEDD